MKNINIKNNSKKNANKEINLNIIIKNENKISNEFEDMNIKFKEYLTAFVKNDYSIYISIFRSY